MPKKKQTKSGSALIFATIILFSLLAITVTLSAITVQDMKMSQKTKSSTGAFFNADSGVEWALYKITNSDSSMKINSLPGVVFNTDGSAQCPFGGCNVFFLKDDGTVITQAQAGSLYVSDIKAVRSVGTQGAETQRAIEAAVAASSCSICPAKFVGATSSSYTGDLGGYSGANSICSAQYGAGARMCMAADFVNGTPNVKGWFSTFTSFATPPVSGSQMYYWDCEAWTDGEFWHIPNSVANYGQQWSFDSFTPFSAAGGIAAWAHCSDLVPILCCK